MLAREEREILERFESLQKRERPRVRGMPMHARKLADGGRRGGGKRCTFRFCRYCLSLLLSTLRCQEETRLKLQCQDLLVVSKKLFTRLGEPAFYLPSFPFLAS